MNKDYGVLLENLLGRRYDEALRESIVTEAFYECEYPDCLKYTLEAMQEIDPSYAYKTFHITRRIQEKLEKAFTQQKIKVDFRYQGSIQTETHIVLYGGAELIVLIKNEFQKPWLKISQLGQEIMEIFSGDKGLKLVDYSSLRAVKLVTTKPTSEIRVLPALWVESSHYLSTKREIDRGICEFNFQKKTTRKYLPFLNIARINSKDQRCNGGLKKMIRLLRSLQRDAGRPIEMSNYEISSMLYGIPDKQLTYHPEYALSLLGVVAAQMNRLLTDRKYRETLVSPSEKELVFGKKEHLTQELHKLKEELDALMQDLHKVLRAEDKTIYSPITY